MEYQHHVSIWNYATGKLTRGCFRTRELAEKFMAETEGEEKSYSSHMDNWPYGSFEQNFDVDAARERQQEWADSHGGDDGKWN